MGARSSQRLAESSRFFAELSQFLVRVSRIEGFNRLGKTHEKVLRDPADDECRSRVGEDDIPRSAVEPSLQNPKDNFSIMCGVATLEVIHPVHGQAKG